MKKILLGLIAILSISFAQCGMGYGTGLFGFILLVLAFFLFSVIFWAVYRWIVKGKEKKE